MWKQTVDRLPKDPFVYLAAIGAITIGKYSVEYLKDVLISTYLFFNKFKLNKQAQVLVDRRNKNVRDFLEKHKNEITEERIEEIVYLSASELAHKIRQKEIKSREAVLAYSIRAATIGIKLHLINDVFFEEALVEAEAADRILKSTTDISTLPPLFGLPMTIKDYVHYKGKTVTLGYKFLADKISTYDSHAVAIIKKAGAIPYCFTNVPQGLFSFEASNFMWGGAENPWDRSRTPGGSSGGCGGSVASFCSPLSLTGDIGGSTRVPASFNGLYGLKPSHSRITSKDQLRPSGEEYSGWKTWLVAPGTISRKFEDLLLFARTFYGKFNEDFSLPQKLFDEKAYSEGLTNYFDASKKAKIGICNGFSLSEPFEEQKAALDKVRQHFISLGHEVVDFSMESHMELYEKSLINISIVLGLIKLGLRGERPYYYYGNYINSIGSNWISKKLWSSAYRLIGKERIAKRFEAIDPSLNDTLTFLGNSKYIDLLKEKFFDHMRKTEIDTIIMPVMPFPAGKRDNFDYQLDHLFYNMIGNVLNLSGGAVPIQIIEDTTYITKHNDSIARSIRDSMKDAKGLPFGFQVLTLPYQDEKALRLMQEVDKVFKFSENKKVWDAHKEKVKSYSK